MGISIRTTIPSEAETLSKIQKAAFKPLYEKYHDEGNPFLRGPEDILCRMNRYNRYFTILYDEKIVGGVLYRLSGKRSPIDKIEKGEYYLARIYIHPDYQNKGVAREVFMPANVKLPMIYEVEKDELSECLVVIHQSFRTLLFCRSTDTMDSESFFLIMRRIL